MIHPKVGSLTVILVAGLLILRIGEPLCYGRAHPVLGPV